ncbi:hypothetical protein BC332_30315 [Capsicum chinense]|nr:hypothetical protein BC332_30315 [Capsicum chinense]
MAFLWLALAVVAIVFLLLQQLQKKFSKKKKILPPGPRGLPLLGNLHMFGDNLHQDLNKIAKKHGPIMSIHFGLVPVIVASTPYAAEQFLKTHDLTFSSRPSNQVSENIFYKRKNLVSARYGPYWRNMRKLCTLQLLSNAKILAFQPMRKQERGILINFVKQAAMEHKVVDLTAKVGSLSANMSSLMIFGKKYMDEDLGEKGFKAIIQDMLHIAALPNVTLRYKNDNNNFGFNNFGFSNVICNMPDLLIASMDTSLTTIDRILTKLLRHPDVMKKVHNELEQVVGKNRMVEESDLESLEYLDMVIKDCNRLYPAAPLLPPHESIEDCTVNNFHSPKGSRVLINIWKIGRDSDTWVDPEKFKLERLQGSNIDLRG